LDNIGIDSIRNARKHHSKLIKGNAEETKIRLTKTYVNRESTLRTETPGNHSYYLFDISIPCCTA